MAQPIENLNKETDTINKYQIEIRVLKNVTVEYFPTCGSYCFWALTLIFG